MTVLRRRIGLTDIRALKPGESVWDAAVGGFHARRQKTKAVSYVLAYRTSEGRQRWFTLGRHGAPWTPDAAREEAKIVLGRVAKGEDPAAEKYSRRKAKTVGELCDAYMEDAEAGRLLTRRKAAKKPGTLLTDRGRVARHIKPMIGNLKVAAVTQNDVREFMNAVAEGKTAGRFRTEKQKLICVRGGWGTASRVVGLLGSIFGYAITHGMCQTNPVRGVIRPADKVRTRRLCDREDDNEYKMLAGAFQKAQDAKVWPAAVAAARFLLLSGWRSGEALGLRWSEVDLARQTAILADTKTGRSLRPLSSEACNVLRTMPRINGSEYVFPAMRGDGRMIGFPKLWGRIAKLGGLPDDVTPHTLRHSFASLAADLGYSELTIAALIGHKGHSITSRYVHSADAVLLAAASAVADRTTALMRGVVTQLRKVSG